jgi:hypothetical protein
MSMGIGFYWRVYDQWKAYMGKFLAYESQIRMEQLGPSQLYFLKV